MISLFFVLVQTYYARPAVVILAGLCAAIMAVVLFASGSALAGFVVTLIAVMVLITGVQRARAVGLLGRWGRPRT